MMDTTIDELSAHLDTLTTSSNELIVLDNCRPLSTHILPSMSSCPMVTDGFDHLLIYHQQTLLLLKVPTFETIFSLPIFPLIECPISDICYYSIFNCFLFSSSNTIYSLTSNKQIQTIHTFSKTIWSITHASHSIFICYLFGFSIEQWQLTEDNKYLVNTWLKETLIETLDMGINCIRIIDQCLGMTIKENHFSWRIDIFDVLTMTRLRRGQTIEQENHLSNWIGILCPIDCFRWLFADGEQGLILIDQTNNHNHEQHQIMRIACNISLILDINTHKYSSIVVQSHDGLNLYPLR